MPANPTRVSPAETYLARLAAGSRRTTGRRLRAIALALGFADPRAVPWHSLRYEQVAGLRLRLTTSEPPLAPATVNAMLSAVRQVLEEAWRLGLMSREDFERASSIENVHGSRLPAGRALEDAEIRALLVGCLEDDSPAGARDAAMIAILVGCGLRRAELAHLALEDVLLGPPMSLRVLGKGNKQRLAYPPEGVVAHLELWLESRGRAPGPLFITTTKAGGIVPGHGISQATVYYTLAKRAAAASISCSPHDLRRAFGTGLLRRGVDLATVQRLMGHASVATTTIYDHRGEAEDRRAAERADVPLV